MRAERCRLLSRASGEGKPRWSSSPHYHPVICQSFPRKRVKEDGPAEVWNRSLNQTVFIFYFLGTKLRYKTLDGCRRLDASLNKEFQSKSLKVTQNLQGAALFRSLQVSSKIRTLPKTKSNIERRNMHFSTPIVLGIGILSSLAAAVSLPPEGPEWVADIQSHINDHENELSPSQVDALNDALVLAVTRDEKLAPEMKSKMIDAFGKEEAFNLLTSRAPYCECVPEVSYTCGEGETCIVGGCEKLLGRCVSTFPAQCSGLCF